MFSAHADLPNEVMGGLNMLTQYSYDPLDRLVGYGPEADPPAQRFYCKSRLATEVEGVITHCFIQGDNQLLAQQRHINNAVHTALLMTDFSGSVFQVQGATQPHSIAYTAYGYRPIENGLISVLGFNGERCDSVTGHYLLGNGYRAFNPVLMRFNGPDSMSPFGEGGINAYAFNSADPVNWVDPSGRAPVRVIANLLKPIKQRVLNGRVIKKGVARRVGSDFSKVSSLVSGKSLLTESERHLVEMFEQVKAGNTPITVNFNGVDAATMERARKFINKTQAGPGRKVKVFKQIKAENFEPADLPYEIADVQLKTDRETLLKCLGSIGEISRGSRSVTDSRITSNRLNREVFNSWVRKAD